MDLNNTGMQLSDDEKNTFKKAPKHIELPLEDDDQAEIPACCRCVHTCGECCGFVRTWCPLLCCVEYPYRIVNQGNEGLFEKFGKYKKTVKPGLHYINPCTEDLNQISMKIIVLDLNRQVLPPLA